MLRIRGTIGDWPVDLTLELDEGDWAQLGEQLQAAKPATREQAVASPRQDDTQMHSAKALLRQVGQMTGPALLAELEALTGSATAGKRLLVRLRHSTDVKVQSGEDAPLYIWVG